MVAAEAPDPLGLALVADAGLMIPWLVTHAGEKGPKIIIPGGGGSRGWGGL